MARLCFFYVKTEDAEALEQELEPGESVFPEPGLPYVGVDVGSDQDVPEERIQLVSEEHKTEVIWLSYEAAAGSFHYQRWDSGKLLREVMHGITEPATWEKSTGESEPWEMLAIFPDAKIQELLADDALSEDLGEEMVDTICKKKQLVVGQFLPMVDALECAQAIAEHFRLPGWELTDL